MGVSDEEVGVDIRDGSLFFAGRDPEMHFLTLYICRHFNLFVVGLGLEGFVIGARLVDFVDAVRGETVGTNPGTFQHQQFSVLVIVQVQNSLLVLLNLVASVHDAAMVVID